EVWDDAVKNFRSCTCLWIGERNDMGKRSRRQHESHGAWHGNTLSPWGSIWIRDSGRSRWEEIAIRLRSRRRDSTPASGCASERHRRSVLDTPALRSRGGIAGSSADRMVAGENRAAPALGACGWPEDGTASRAGFRV